jgi:hypothetical protein
MHVQAGEQDVRIILSAPEQPASATDAKPASGKR